MIDVVSEMTLTTGGGGVAAGIDETGTGPLARGLTATETTTETETATGREATANGTASTGSEERAATVTAIGTGIMTGMTGITASGGANVGTMGSQSPMTTAQRGDGKIVPLTILLYLHPPLLVYHPRPLAVTAPATSTAVLEIGPLALVIPVRSLMNRGLALVRSHRLPQIGLVPHP